MHQNYLKTDLKNITGHTTRISDLSVGLTVAQNLLFNKYTCDADTVDPEARYSRNPKREREV